MEGAACHNALERINEEFRRRIKAPALLPNEEAVLFLLFGLWRTGQITLRRIVGWQDLTSSQMEATERKRKFTPPGIVNASLRCAPIANIRARAGLLERSRVNIDSKNQWRRGRDSNPRYRLPSTPD
jgi:hypothetical protein